MVLVQFFLSNWKKNFNVDVSSFILYIMLVSSFPFVFGEKERERGRNGTRKLKYRQSRTFEQQDMMDSKKIYSSLVRL